MGHLLTIICYLPLSTNLSLYYLFPSSLTQLLRIEQFIHPWTQGWINYIQERSRIVVKWTLRIIFYYLQIVFDAVYLRFKISVTFSLATICATWITKDKTVYLKIGWILCAPVFKPCLLSCSRPDRLVEVRPDAALTRVRSQSHMLQGANIMNVLRSSR